MSKNDRVQKRSNNHNVIASLVFLAVSELGINHNRADNPIYRLSSKRLSSYRFYIDSDHVMKANDLSNAGFYYEGPSDKVRCFWCSGALESWSEDDDPWKEHARYTIDLCQPYVRQYNIVTKQKFIFFCKKYVIFSRWYPGCTFVQQIKGKTFIKNHRASLSTEELDTANSLEYNSTDLFFLGEIWL